MVHCIFCMEQMANCFSVVITGIRCNFVPTTEVLIPSRWHLYCIPVAGIACFKCVSVNGDNPSCEDRFHNNATAGIVELVSPCMGGRKGRDGLFPASDCIKVTGVYGEDRFQLLKDLLILCLENILYSWKALWRRSKVFHCHLQKRNYFYYLQGEQSSRIHQALISWHFPHNASQKEIFQ